MDLLRVYRIGWNLSILSEKIDNISAPLLKTIFSDVQKLDAYDIVVSVMRSLSNDLKEISISPETVEDLNRLLEENRSILIEALEQIENKDRIEEVINKRNARDFICKSLKSFIV